jgi:hypothetical protein
VTPRVRNLTIGSALCAGLWLVACGGATGDPLGHGVHHESGGTESGTGGSAQNGNGGEAGDGSGGASAGAASGAGGKGSGGAIGRGGSTGSGGRVGSGGSFGSGGSVGSGGVVIGTGGRAAETGGRGPGTGGDGGVPSWSCRTPYRPPIVGPRKDGPINPGMDCNSLPDSVVLERYADESAKVPTGFFYEEPGEIVYWNIACSASLDATTMAARTEVGGTLDGTATTPYFYEAAMCNGDARTRYRRLRCDYYDGTHLKRGPTTSGVDDLLFWSGLMWFVANENLDGAMLISGSTTIGNATDLAEICTTKTTYGDFGLCDSITLTSTVVKGSVDGTAGLVSIVDLRTIKGKCR